MAAFTTHSGRRATGEATPTTRKPIIHEVACGDCGAEIGERCTALGDESKIVDTHRSRKRMAHRSRVAREEKS